MPFINCQVYNVWNFLAFISVLLQFMCFKVIPLEKLKFGKIGGGGEFGDGREFGDGG